MPLCAGKKYSTDNEKITWLPSSVLAFVTTVHLGMASLRNHRRVTPGPFSSLAAVSLLFAATPWLFPSAIGVGFGLAAHLAWFIACEVLVPRLRPMPRVREPALAPEAIGRPSTSATATQGVRPGTLFSPPSTRHPTSRRSGLRDRRASSSTRGNLSQYAFAWMGRMCSRCYSVSSAPDVRGYFEISVKRQGLVSNALHATARPGATLSVRSPNGAFKYPSGDDRPIVLLAGGVGITPLMSMIRHAVHTEPSRPVTLLYSARSEADFAFREELAVLARRHPQVRVHLASSSSSSPDIYPGRVDAELIRDDGARRRAFGLLHLRSGADDRSPEAGAGGPRRAGPADPPRSVRSGGCSVGRERGAGGARLITAVRRRRRTR